MAELIRVENFEPNLQTNSLSGAPNILDRGREEIFRRAYNNIETKSGAFRYYGLGRALSPSGQVQAQAALEALIELRATNNSAGQRILRPVVVQRKVF